MTHSMAKHVSFRPGPNGAGKTTFLNLLAQNGLTPCEGEVGLVVEGLKGYVVRWCRDLWLR